MNKEVTIQKKEKKSLIVQCQKNPKKQPIGEKSQNLFFQGEFTTQAPIFDCISQQILFHKVSYPLCITKILFRPILSKKICSVFDLCSQKFELI